MFIWYICYITLCNHVSHELKLILRAERRQKKKNPEKTSLLLQGAKLDPETRQNFIWGPSKVALGIFFSRAARVSGAAYFLFMSCVFPWRHSNMSSAYMENTQSSRQMLSRALRLAKATVKQWGEDLYDAVGWCCCTTHCDQSHLPMKRSLQIVMLHFWTTNHVCVCVWRRVCVRCVGPNTKKFISGIFFYWLVFKVARLWAAFPLFENMLLLAVSQRCIHLCRRLNYNPLIHLKSERSSGMLRRDNCQASLQTPSAPSTPQGERERERESGRRREERGMNLGMFADRTRSCGAGGGDNMWHHSESWALRHGAFVARSQPDVPSVSKQEWLCEGNFQQFVRF